MYIKIHTFVTDVRFLKILQIDNAVVHAKFPSNDMYWGHNEENHIDVLCAVRFRITLFVDASHKIAERGY